MVRSAARLLFGVGLLAVLFGAARATAIVRDLAIQPDDSTIRVLPTSGIWLDLVAPIGSVFLPFSSQSGGTSTATHLEGWVRVDELLDYGQPGFQIFADRTAIRPAASGSWQPGLPATPGTAAPAPIAVAWSGTWLAGRAALRDVAFSGAAGWPADVVTPGERWRWPAPPFDGPFPHAVELRTQNGVADVDVPLAPDFRFGLSEKIRAALELSIAQRADIRRFGGKLQVILPIAISKELGPNDLHTALPVRVQLDLAGRVVAEEVGYAPEPATAAQLVAAAAALAAIARRRS